MEQIVVDDQGVEGCDLIDPIRKNYFVLQSDWQADTRATDDLVKRLRRKLRDIGSTVCIETVWGYGFRLTMDESASAEK